MHVTYKRYRIILKIPSLTLFVHSLRIIYNDEISQ